VTPTARCTRCGVDRAVNESRQTDNLCRDCRTLLRADERLHGTEIGYRRHLAERTVPCEPCLAYCRERQAEYRRRKGQRIQQPARCGTTSGYLRHVKTLRETACETCKAAQATYMREWRARRRAA
jgi:hypothetical protein